jgi:hypothetical protein
MEIFFFVKYYIWQARNAYGCVKIEYKILTRKAEEKK